MKLVEGEQDDLINNLGSPTAVIASKEGWSGNIDDLIKLSGLEAREGCGKEKVGFRHAPRLSRRQSLVALMFLVFVVHGKDCECLLDAPLGCICLCLLYEQS